MKSKPNTKPGKTKELKTKVKLSSKATGKSKSESAVASNVGSKPVTKVQVKAQAASAQTKMVLLKNEKSKKLSVTAGVTNKSATQKTSEKKLLSRGRRSDKSSDVAISADKSRAALDVKKSTPKPTSRKLGQVVETQQRKTAPSSSVQPVVPAADSIKKRPIQVTQTVSHSASSSVAATSAAPSKSTRPSARLSQVTVPSMAQAVASTAAKASYMPVQPEVVISPPLPSALKKDAKLVNNWKTKPVEELSDAELQAMPDSEYMNAVQLAAFRLRLMALRRDILSSAGETTEHLREDTSVVPDPADRATIEEEHALELRTRDRERKLLKKIEQAIERIDANDYGYCDETGEPIGVGRLLARPTATLSLEAQQRRELKQKMFGD